MGIFAIAFLTYSLVSSVWVGSVLGFSSVVVAVMVVEVVFIVVVPGVSSIFVEVIDY